RLVTLKNETTFFKNKIACDLTVENYNPPRTVEMNRKFGGGKQPTGTPSLAWSTIVVVASLLAGASVVHNIYKPDLRLSPVGNVDEHEADQVEKLQN
ncbi:hypothetical protein MIMGU_mgv1a024441mg, partial [Erythranthe guttata]